MLGNIVDKRWQTRGTSRDMKDCCGFRPTSNHIHMPNCFDSGRQCRPCVEESNSPLDLRWPDKTNRPCGSGNLVFADEFAERACHFENGYASAGVVVGARPLVIEMTTESDFLSAQIRVR